MQSSCEIVYVAEFDATDVQIRGFRVNVSIKYTSLFGVQLDSKLHFQAHVDYIISQSLRTLGLIRVLTYSISALDCLLLLFSTLVRPKLEYASVVWNSVTSTDARKQERIQRKFAALLSKSLL